MGRVIRTESLAHVTLLELPWPEEIRCDHCVLRDPTQKHRAHLRVQLREGVYRKLCLCCWLWLALGRPRIKHHHGLTLEGVPNEELPPYLRPTQVDD